MSISDQAIPMLMPLMRDTMGMIGDAIVSDIEDTLDTAFPMGMERYSHPSETPYLRTGRLFVGVRHFTEEDDFALTERIVSSRATDDGASENVPFDLEFGTDKNAAYPFMSPAMDRAKDTIPAIVRAGVSL